MLARWVGGGLLLGLTMLALVFVVDRTLRPPRITAPAPETVADVAPEPLPPSNLAVPIRVELASLLAELESSVPLRWGSLEERHTVGDRTDVAFALERSPFTASFEGSLARLTATIHYRARAWYDPPVLPTVSASCGTGEDERAPRLVVTLEAPITVTPDWRLAAEAGIGGIRPASDDDRDRCRVTVIRLDMTGRVIEGARSVILDHAAEIDSLVANVDVRSSFEGWWATLAEPVELTENIWLVMDPLSVRRGAIRGEGEAVVVPVTLTARPRVVVGRRPDVTVPPLPPLDVGEVEPGLEILAEGRAEYETASRMLTDEFRGREFSRGERMVRIRSVTVSGIGGGRLALAVDVTGSARGVLYLVGTPEYDPETGQVAVPDLDFDIATADVLLEGASWLARAGLAGLMRQQARWPAAPAVDWVSEQLGKGLNRSLSDEVALRGSVGEVTILGVRAMRDALIVRARASARASLEVVEDR